MYNLLKVKNLIISPGKPAICAPIVGKTEQEIILIIRRIKEEKIDLAEWRADFFQDIEDERIFEKVLNTVVRELKGMPYIFTFRTKEEGGQKQVDREWYIWMIKKVCQGHHADLIDIELNTLSDEDIKKLIKIANDNKVKVVLSSHDFEKTPSQAEIVAQLLKMEKIGADIAKLAVMPNSRQDLLTLLAATEEMNSNYAKIPIVTMSMERTGFASRILGEVFGSAITFGIVTKASAPGQVGVKDLYNLLELIHRNIKPKLNNLIFIGFMGTGKTSVTRALAKMTNMKVVDMDEYIQEKMHLSIPEIFEKYGEYYFRELETEAMVEILKGKDQLVSCGGGIILRDENVRFMKDKGKIVLLTATSEEILKRVQNNKNRPLLENSGREEIDRMYESRKDKYIRAADFTVDTTNKSVDEICNEIISNIL